MHCFDGKDFEQRNDDDGNEYVDMEWMKVMMVLIMIAMMIHNNDHADDEEDDHVVSIYRQHQQVPIDSQTGKSGM